MTHSNIFINVIIEYFIIKFIHIINVEDISIIF